MSRRRRVWGPLAPGVRAALRGLDGPTELGLYGVRSLRGLETAPTLEALTVPPARLDPVARLPRLRRLFVVGRGEDVDLRPLAACRALDDLGLHGVRARHAEALDGLTALRTVLIAFTRSPRLDGLARLPLRRLELDDVTGVRPWELRGLPVEELDLWGCGITDLDVLATMPNLREVWLNGNRVESLAPLLHVRPGGRIVLDHRFEPARHRAALDALEARGVGVLAAHDPEGVGVWPGWSTAAPFRDTDAREVYRSPGFR